MIKLLSVGLVRVPLWVDAELVGVLVAIGGGLAKVVVANAPDEEEKLSKESKASTVYEYVVLAVRPVSLYMRSVVVAICTASRNTRYPATNTSSVDAPHVTSICVAATGVTESNVGVVGGVLSLPINALIVKSLLAAISKPGRVTLLKINPKKSILIVIMPMR
jgi:hypothetical protein